jgi:hypothetical protein
VEGGSTQHSRKKQYFYRSRFEESLRGSCSTSASRIFGMFIQKTTKASRCPPNNHPNLLPALVLSPSSFGRICGRVSDFTTKGLPILRCRPRRGSWIADLNAAFDQHAVRISHNKSQHASKNRGCSRLNKFARDLSCRWSDRCDHGDGDVEGNWLSWTRLRGFDK